MSLAPTGFWSYTREDDSRSRGRLSQLRTLLADELQGHIGRAERVHVFQDVAAIPYGSDWDQEIGGTLEECSFFIPIVTPAFLQSEMCCRELIRFRQRETALRRNDLIFPIHYIDVDDVAPDQTRRVFDRTVWDCLRSRQQVDFRHLRLLPPDSTVEVALKLEQLALAIVAALRRPASARQAAATPVSVGAPRVVTVSPGPASAAPDPPAAASATVAPGRDDAPSVAKLRPARRWRRNALWAGAGLAAACLAIAAMLPQRFWPSGAFHAAVPPGAVAPARPGATAPASPVANPLPPAPTAAIPLPAPASGSVIRDCPTCPEMTLVPHGSFTMGVAPGEEDRETMPKDYRGRSEPQHRVSIARDFYIGRYAVTKAEYSVFVSKAGQPAPGTCWAYEMGAEGKWSMTAKSDRDWHYPGFPQSDRDPVVCVNLADAEAYAAWLSRETGKPYRLPSEAEWEYAARAGTSTARFWGDARDGACRYGNVADATLKQRTGWAEVFSCDDHYVFTAPVGSFAPNGFALFDMLGNVWQWTADRWHDNYRDAPSDGSAWITGGDDAQRDTRGGSYSAAPWFVRAGFRSWVYKTDRYAHIGFRLVRPLPLP